ncbi:MAG: N-acetylmuramoyl-L-alanine amidase family protein, partial [Terriglobales bacterium]
NLDEKNVVLDVTLRLGKLLQRRLGLHVVYTRTADVFVPLQKRTEIANAAHADLFVSIHANSSPSAHTRGVETYYLNFTRDPRALAVAARENAGSGDAIHDLPHLLKTIALNNKLEESHELAEDVQRSLARAAGEDNRGVKTAPFVVLIGARMPSILAEISFLSNRSDDRELRTNAYRQRIAEGLYQGLRTYILSLSGSSAAALSGPSPTPGMRR